MGREGFTLKKMVGGLLGPVTMRAHWGREGSNPCTVATKPDAVRGTELGEGGSDGPRERTFALGNFRGPPTENFVWFMPFHRFRDDLCMN